MTNCLCIFGFGYTARYLTQMVRDDGMKVVGICRDLQKAADNAMQPDQLIHFSEKALAESGISPTHVLVSTPPSASGDPSLIAFERYLSKVSPSLQAIAYLSTTGVYGEHDGEWVDESSACRHPGEKAQQRLAAEKSWLAFSERNRVPLYIFRIAGIYGPYRNALQKIKNGATHSIFKQGQYFSRIHVEDLAKTIKTGLLSPDKAGVYNVCDNEPASNTVVDDFAANLLGVKPLNHQLFEEATLSPMAREFFSTNKKVANLKMRTILGVELSYPTYREGLTSLYNNNQY